MMVKEEWFRKYVMTLPCLWIALAILCNGSESMAEEIPQIHLQLTVIQNFVEIQQEVLLSELNLKKVEAPTKVLNDPNRILSEKKVGSGLSAELVEFQLRADADILKMDPRPEKVAEVVNGSRSYIFARQNKYHFEYRIPLSMISPIQIMLDEESNWYFQSKQIAKANFEIKMSKNSLQKRPAGQGRSINTVGQEIKLVTSKIPGSQSGLSAALGEFVLFQRESKRRAIVDAKKKLKRDEVLAAAKEISAEEARVKKAPVKEANSEIVEDEAGGVQLQIFLASNDFNLAQSLLDNLENYLAHYEDLLGPYPYQKFSVVENLAQTGFAFPSMTWIGSQLLRFSFIQTSSLPHELLHSWWGNGVFVNPEYGNWCEGLTTYMADYFYQPSEAAKRTYRLKQLLEYENYVKEGSEIALREFTSRGEDRSLQAVGYGKSMMVFHMLENQIGEENFRQTLRRFSSKFMGRSASFKDFFDIASEVSGQNLFAFFEDWILKKGTLDLSFAKHEKFDTPGGSRVRSAFNEGPHRIEGLLLPFITRVAEDSHFVAGTAPIMASTIEIETQHSIKTLWFDPGFDLFRKIKPLEKPTALSSVFGQHEINIVSISSSDFVQSAISQLKKNEQFKITEKGLGELNFDLQQNLIIIGLWQDLQTSKSPRLAEIILKLRELGVEMPKENDNKILIEGQKFDIGDRAFLFSLRIGNADLVGVIAQNSVDGARLAQRMLHYGSQSYALLTASGSLSQNLWPGQKSELYIEF